MQVLFLLLCRRCQDSSLKLKTPLPLINFRLLSVLLLCLPNLLSLLLCLECFHLACLVITLQLGPDRLFCLITWVEDNQALLLWNLQPLRYHLFETTACHLHLLCKTWSRQSTTSLYNNSQEQEVEASPELEYFLPSMPM